MPSAGYHRHCTHMVHRLALCFSSFHSTASSSTFSSSPIAGLPTNTAYSALPFQLFSFGTSAVPWLSSLWTAEKPLHSNWFFFSLSLSSEQRSPRKGWWWASRQAAPFCCFSSPIGQCVIIFSGEHAVLVQKQVTYTRWWWRWRWSEEPSLMEHSQHLPRS